MTMDERDTRLPNYWQPPFVLRNKNLISVYDFVFSTQRMAYNSNFPYWSFACFFFKFLKGFDSCITFDLSYIRVLWTSCSFFLSIIPSNIILCISSGCLQGMSNHFSTPFSNRIYECTFFSHSAEYVFICFPLYSTYLFHTPPTSQTLLVFSLRYYYLFDKNYQILTKSKRY